MKWLIILLSVWTLILSAVPCCVASLRAPATEQGATRTDDDCPDDDHATSCSPFCSCSTCTGFIVPCPQVLPVACSHQLSVAVYAFCPLPPMHVLLLIWQPPKLV